MTEHIQRLDTLLQRYRAAMTIMLGEDEQEFQIRLDTLELCVLEIEEDFEECRRKLEECMGKHFPTYKQLSPEDYLASDNNLFEK
jgi:hypothetical protein